MQDDYQLPRLLSTHHYINNLPIQNDAELLQVVLIKMAQF